MNAFPTAIDGPDVVEMCLQYLQLQCYECYIIILLEVRNLCLECIKLHLNSRKYVHCHFHWKTNMDHTYISTTS